MICKRCGRELTSPKSIKLGYGATCYRIVQLQKVEKPEAEPEFSQEIAFLRCEIKTLKRMFRNIQTNGSIDSIERINRDNRRPEREPQKINMFVVIKELKVVFEGDFRSRLEKVPESFLNHESIYNNLTLAVEV